jgi:hypothetical protein
VIPAEAVEAAAIAVHDEFCRDPYHSGHVGPACYDYKNEARTILEAAAPYMLAEIFALHYPQGDSYRTCAHCIEPSVYPNRPEQPVRWPCPTAIAAGLFEVEK